MVTLQDSSSTCNSNGVAKRRGRPRKGGIDRTALEQQVITEATRLFREQGFQNTTMTQIARAVGLDQSSLYYYFPSKASILNRIVDFKDMQRIISEITQMNASRTEQLYVLIIHDVMFKCRLPFDFIEFEKVAIDCTELFMGLFDFYRMFYQALEHTISAGIQEGEFSACDAAEQAVAVLSINEGLQHHYHAKIRGELILEAAGYQAKGHSPEAIGHMAACAAMPAIAKRKLEYDSLRDTLWHRYGQFKLAQERANATD